MDFLNDCLPFSRFHTFPSSTAWPHSRLDLLPFTLIFKGKWSVAPGLTSIAWNLASLWLPQAWHCTLMQSEVPRLNSLSILPFTPMVSFLDGASYHIPFSNRLPPTVCLCFFKGSSSWDTFPGSWANSNDTVILSDVKVVDDIFGPVNEEWRCWTAWEAACTQWSCDMIDFGFHKQLAIPHVTLSDM